MLSRNLGQSGISVSAIGLGCMGLSEFYGEPTQETEAINLLHRAVDLGITHFDTAEIYGQGRNEQLLGKAFAFPPKHQGAEAGAKGLRSRSILLCRLAQRWAHQ